MWGRTASPYSVHEYAHTSMKWHLVDETSLEKKIITVREWEKDIGYMGVPVERTYGFLDCGRLGRTYTGKEKIPLVLKDAIKLTQSNICTYCKKARMEELQIEAQLI